MDIKCYMIVTNDANEEIVKMDLVGAKEVAEYLGKSVNRVRKNICTGRWNHKDKYKAIVDEEGTEEMLIERYIDWQSRLADYHREYRKRRKEYDRITDCV